MRPYSLDLHERVAAAIDHREGFQREIARWFRVTTRLACGYFRG